jgi:hypothetical protein
MKIPKKQNIWESRVSEDGKEYNIMLTKCDTCKHIIIISNVSGKYKPYNKNLNNHICSLIKKTKNTLGKISKYNKIINKQFKIAVEKEP